MPPSLDDARNYLETNDFSKATNNKIKPPFASEEEIEEFLKNGGSILIIPFGERSEAAYNPFHQSLQSQKQVASKNTKQKDEISILNNKPPHEQNTPTQKEKTTKQPSAKDIAKDMVAYVKKCQEKPVKEKVVKEKPVVTKKAKEKPPLSSEAKRLAELKSAKNKALENNEQTFEARCKTHGQTTYAFFGSTPRCLACRTKQDATTLTRYRNKTPDKLQQLNDNSDRLSRNSKAYNKALKTNAPVFIAECNFHNFAPFIIETRSNRKAQSSYRCLECKKISHFAYRLSKKPA